MEQFLKTALPRLVLINKIHSTVDFDSFIDSIPYSLGSLTQGVIDTLTDVIEFFTVHSGYSVHERHHFFHCEDGFSVPRWRRCHE